MVNEISSTILRLLVEAQLLAPEKAQELEAKNAQVPVDLRKELIEMGLVKEEDFIRVWAQALNIPYVDLANLQPPKEVLGIIPESTARGHMIIAFQDAPEALKVAMADPNDRQIVDFIHKKVGKSVEVSLASTESIRLGLNWYQESLEAELQNLVEESKAVSTEDDDSKAAENIPIIRLTDAILRHAIRQGASDIHIEPTEDQVVIRYRIDGILNDVLVLPKKVSNGLVARIKVLSNLKIDEHRLPQDGRFKIEATDYQVAFRVSTLPVFDGEKIVMRLLDESGQGLGLDDIGMTPRTLEIFRRNIAKPHGMVLVTGPTGSGKTTTLYAAMRELNTPDVNISTIEDPIEYRMQRINQTQVQPQIGLTFSNGLRALVRQDPDIIMVGEIRDQETASLAVNAALTGHLVLSTLHTNSAAGALPRLLDMGVEAFLVASTTNLLMAQRLVRRLCPDCRQEVALSKVMIDSLGKVINLETMMATLVREKYVPAGTTWEAVKTFQAHGCRKCHEGYKGRLGIYEVLEVTPEIQKMMTATVTSNDLEKAAREQQFMVTMLEDGIIKTIQGATTIEEVLRVAEE
jgi:type IV pilus assembly protein PilB